MQQEIIRATVQSGLNTARRIDFVHDAGRLDLAFLAERKTSLRVIAHTLSTQNFSEMEVLMTTRIVWKAADDLEPQLAIELWRLEAVGCEHNLKTTPAPRLRLGRFEKTTPDSLPSMFLVHPDLTNLAAPAPCVPAEPSDYLTLSIATENSNTQRIDDSSRLGVEFV